MSNRTERLRRALLVGALLAAVGVGSGCEFLGLDGGEAEQTEQQEQSQDEQPDDEPEEPAEPQQEQPKPSADEEDEYTRPEYPNMARRNPFQPDVEVVTPATVPVEGEERTLEPLEQFAIGQLSLVAIISEVAVPKAMFIDPDGFGHVLKEGDRIGQNSGVLSDIRDNEVEITETTGDDGGQTRLRKVKLREVELSSGDRTDLTEEERAALEKLLETEEGRQALERQYRDMALGASAVDDEGSGNQRQQGNTRKTFPGIRPPSQNE